MYVLLGSSGQITSQIARILLDGGHPVRVIGRNREALAGLEDAGARIAVGDPADAAFLASAFADATAVYTMLPPCYQEPDMRAAQHRIGEAIAEALRRATGPRVVNLSSVGAELPHGTGPIEALHAQEQRLDAIGTVDLLHLRAGYFMENLLAAIPEIAAAGVISGMESPDAPIPMVATADIAQTVAQELVTLRHRGVLQLQAPRHITLREAARVIGSAIGKPDLQYLQAAPEETKRTLRTHGMSADAVDQLEALSRWLSRMSTESATAATVAVQATTIEAFARERFAPAYARGVTEGA